MDRAAYCDIAPFSAWTVPGQPTRFPNQRLVTTLRCPVGLLGWRGGADHPHLSLGADRYPASARILGRGRSLRLGELVVRGKSKEECACRGEGEAAREIPPPLSCSTGAHPIPVGPVTSPVIPSSNLVHWRMSGVGGGRRRNVKASRTKAKDKVKASRTKAKDKVKASRTKKTMSSSGSDGVAPAWADHSGERAGPPGTGPAPVGGVIPGVALPASKASDAPPPSLLAPAMLVRLYSVVVGVVPAPPEDVSTTERFQQFQDMRLDLATSWNHEQRR